MCGGVLGSSKINDLEILKIAVTTYDPLNRAVTQCMNISHKFFPNKKNITIHLSPPRLIEEQLQSQRFHLVDCCFQKTKERWHSYRTLTLHYDPSSPDAILPTCFLLPTERTLLLTWTNNTPVLSALNIWDGVKEYSSISSS